jgi:alanine dehydrogenase
MIIGVPTETKPAERRVALTPNDCGTLAGKGILVHIQAGAGQEAGFSDAAYTNAGATLQPDAASLYASAEIIVKVKEPLEGDLQHLTPRHILFCYLHLAAAPELVDALKHIGCTAVAFETVVVGKHTPLLAPMSAIAGRLAVQIGTWHLHAPRGGRGVLLGGISQQSAGRVLIIGAGVAGMEAALLAQGMGAQVTILDTNPEKISFVQEKHPEMTADISTNAKMAGLLPQTDLLVGSVYVVGQRAPTVVTEAHIQSMQPGSVAVDISIDQGGCLATSRPCTHDNPVYEVHGVLHSAITNLPAAVPHTASVILSSAIIPYVEQLATGSWSPELTAAVNVKAGSLKLAL